MGIEGGIVQERVKQPDGSWVVREKSLSTDAGQGLVLKGLWLESDDGSKKVQLKLDDDGVLKVVDQSNNLFRVAMIGINQLSGEVVFSNSKVGIVTFTKAFKKKPTVMLTLDNEANAPSYKTSATKTGFTIRLQSSFTGVVSWQATEAEV